MGWTSSLFVFFLPHYVLRSTLMYWALFHENRILHFTYIIYIWIYDFTYIHIVPIHLMGLPLQFPYCKHVLVIFAAFLSFQVKTNPALQINTHFDPYVLLQETFLWIMAPFGVSRGGQVIALIGKRNNYIIGQYLFYTVLAASKQMSFK